MGRRSHSQTLTLWANGEHVGRWTVTARGEMELHYDADWLASPHGRPISLSLPFNLNNEPLRGDHVAHYFEGLLPDSDAIRKRVAARFRTGSTDAFDLLAAIGRDCVGALQLMPEGEAPATVDGIDGVVVDDEAIERHLLEVVTPDRFAGVSDPDDDFRISLAGVQEKDAFLWWDGKWMKPRGATPTTHIFKLPLGLVGGRPADFRTSVDNEWLCLRLFNAYGVSAAQAHIATFGKQRVLVVERFDRRVSSDGTQLFRLIQEDFCQATGTSPLVKYEKEGGPGLKQLFTLVQQSLDPQRDLRTLMASQILFWMLRAPDAHAKNFSIHLQPGTGGRFRLTPMYDVMSAYPVMGRGPNQWAAQDLKLAMALLGKNRHYLMHNVQRRHFNSTAKQVGYGENVEPLLQELVARTPEVVAAVQADLPEGFSQKVADKVLGGLLSAARALEGMPPV
ncbi:type II toxin-antitoxin system HipA family toxin [Paraburkholderia rhizosphaerae]|uniref:Serine/threonine-protein kinase HipA n=1 Tax=Paraburkholderia rhizosphaerae TaxID=480658 RepID=A0A4R8LJU4_9BURK|nr:type II toxin-antitoxin system HipA family toxin [Paraburkholderia rhizosphaerae]TDY44370.1 serine/threonine-protein kinase HipA [Paraburkholderia rhizosphaerae]